ncbi:MAG: hypothetical protein ACH350_01650 [Parachlamydiaceae bacterium]
MNQSFKKLFYFFLIVVSLFIAARIYYALTDDFRLANITYDLPFPAPWRTHPLSLHERQDLEKIMGQNFSYLGKGAQCYAFGSDDGEYVLKFFKFKHLKPNLLVEYLPPIPPLKGYRQSCIERKKRKLIGVFNGYDLAFRKNRQGTQLVYIHLIPTKDLHLQATLIDKIGLKRTIDLDDVVFLVQKKGVTLKTRLRHLLDEGKVREANDAVAHIIEMYVSEYREGIYDHDHGVMQNTGFIGSLPFHLDAGKLLQDDRIKQVEFFKKDLEQVMWKIDMWIKTYYPQYYPQFSIFLAEQYQKWTGEVLDIQAVNPHVFKKRRKQIGF